jgi:hypothetical protein
MMWHWWFHQAFENLTSRCPACPADGTALNFLLTGDWDASSMWMHILIWFGSDGPITPHW